MKTKETESSRTKGCGRDEVVRDEGSAREKINRISGCAGEIEIRTANGAIFTFSEKRKSIIYFVTMYGNPDTPLDYKDLTRAAAEGRPLRFLPHRRKACRRRGRAWVDASGAHRDHRGYDEGLSLDVEAIHELKDEQRRIRDSLETERNPERIAKLNSDLKKIRTALFTNRLISKYPGHTEQALPAGRDSAREVAHEVRVAVESVIRKIASKDPELGRKLKESTRRQVTFEYITHGRNDWVIDESVKMFDAGLPDSGFERKAHVERDLTPDEAVNTDTDDDSDSDDRNSDDDAYFSDSDREPLLDVREETEEGQE